ncbi:MAG: ethanolamine permease [Spirochaetota bacterium]
METSSKQELKKSLKPLHFWGIAVGLVISGDYFGWNYGLRSGALEFLIATIIVTLLYITFTFSFTELSTAIPQAGGPFAYSKRALGNSGGFIAGFATLVEFLFAAPAGAYALGSYINFLIPELNPILISLCFLGLFTAINLMGIQQAANFELFITIIASIGIIVYIALVFPHSSPSSIFTREKPIRFDSIFSAIPFAIWFYLAIEGVAMTAEESENPQKDIPTGYILGIGTLILFALGTMILTAGIGHTDQLVKNDHPLPESLSILYGKGNRYSFIFALFGIVGIMASLLGAILGYSRQIYAVAREGFLPEFLSKLSKSNGSPSAACIAGSLIGAIAILSGRTDKLITLAAIGALVMYQISMISLFVLRKKEPDLKRPFRAPLYPYFPMAALVLSTICLLSIIISNPILSGVFFALLGISFLLFIITIRKDQNQES